MRRLSTIILLILILPLFNVQAVYSGLKGGVSYAIPIHYDKLSEAELNDVAKKEFFLATKLKDGVVNENMTNALFLYNVLKNKNPENIDYSVKLGILYDKIGKDRYAKGAFSRAISINSTKPESYFYFGEYYYKRGYYRSALKYYKYALERTMQPEYDLLYRLGDIYEKLGDTRKALEYLNKAQSLSPSDELTHKINRTKNFDAINKQYYSN